MQFKAVYLSIYLSIYLFIFKVVFLKNIMGAKGLHENIHGFFNESGRKSGFKNIFKRQFLESSLHIFCEQSYKLHVILTTSAMINNYYESCV